MKIVVVFGSQSDQKTYRPLVDALSVHHNVVFHVASAHRDPVKLMGILEEHSDAHAIVAGAGIAAHLPGVVASKVKCPVFGVPVESMFGGLDALLSIVQMPAGVPVLTAAPGRALDIAEFVDKLVPRLPGMAGSGPLEVDVHVGEHLMNYEYLLQELEKAQEFAEHWNVEMRVVHELDESRNNIILVTEEEDVRPHLPALHVPLFDQHHKCAPERVLELMTLVKRGGMWLGVNNVRNAILSYRKCADFFGKQEEQHVHA
jgi:5-(carboxyamino)imidazole ribonucleotide mutase